jgi:hypothetical protein
MGAISSCLSAKSVVENSTQKEDLSLSTSESTLNCNEKIKDEISGEGRLFEESRGQSIALHPDAINFGSLSYTFSSGVCQQMVPDDVEFFVGWEVFTMSIYSIIFLIQIQRYTSKK